MAFCWVLRVGEGGGVKQQRHLGSTSRLLCRTLLYPTPNTHRHVKRCHNVGDVARMGDGSKVVIATGLSLEAGLSRELLVKWGGDGRNAVIFTQQPPVSREYGSLRHARLAMYIRRHVHTQKGQAGWGQDMPAGMHAWRQACPGSFWSSGVGMGATQSSSHSSHR